MWRLRGTCAAGIHPIVRSLASGQRYGSTGQWPLVPGVDAVVRTADGVLAWLSLQARRAELGRLDNVLILGVTGMAGLLAVQNARILGSTRVAGAGRDGTAIQQALEGSSPDIVLDFLWGEPAESTFAALERRGLEADHADISYVQIGAAVGSQAAVPAALLRSRKPRITGSGAGSASISGIIAEIPRYIQLISDGAVDVPVRTFPLSLASEAWHAAQRGRPRVVVVAG